jgi:rubrerythrin
VTSVRRSIVITMDAALEADRCLTPPPESKRLPCDACGAPMEPEHAHYRCPSCGYVLPCCGW